MVFKKYYRPQHLVGGFILDEYSNHSNTNYMKVIPIPRAKYLTVILITSEVYMAIRMTDKKNGFYIPFLPLITNSYLKMVIANVIYAQI